MPFGILDHSEVFYCPKKIQMMKINFGLFSSLEPGSSRSENETCFQRSWGIRGGWRAAGNQESLETTPFWTYSILRNEKLPWMGRNCTFQRLVYNKIGQLLAVAELWNRSASLLRGDWARLTAPNVMRDLYKLNYDLSRVPCNPVTLLPVCTIEKHSKSLSEMADLEHPKSVTLSRHATNLSVTVNRHGTNLRM